MKSPLVIYIDMDDVLCDYTGAYRQKLSESPEIAFPQSQYGFYASLAPIEYAIGSVETLMSDKRFIRYILTAPSYKNPLSYTEKRAWVERYFGETFTQNLIICDNKSLVKGDVLIDDNNQGKGQ